MPQIAENWFQSVDAFKEWSRDVPFTLKSQTSKNIVSVGIAVVVPVRGTDLACGDPPRGVWCVENPHWYDGGCPELVAGTLHWSLTPALTVSGLKVRYRAEAKGMYGTGLRFRARRNFE
jgi:hypothetical protein